MTSTTPQFSHNIRTFFMVGFVLLVAAMIGVVIYTTQDIVKPVLSKEYMRGVEEAGNRIVVDINSQLQQAEMLASTLAYETEIHEPDAALIMHCVPGFLDQIKLRKVIAGGGVWPEPYMFDPQKERCSFFWGRNSEGKLIFYDDYNMPSGNGYHHEEWYVPVKYVQDGHSFWSRAYIDPYSLQPMVTCSVPIRFDGRFYGVATVDLKLEGLAELFASTAGRIKGYIFAVDRNNRFISFPEEELVLKKDPAGDDDSGLQKFITIQELAKRFPEFAPVSQVLQDVNRDMIDIGSMSPDYMQGIDRKIAEESYQIDLPEARLIAAILTDPLKHKTEKTNRLVSLHISDDIILHEPSYVTVFHMPHTYWKIVAVVPEKGMIAPVNQIINRITAWLALLLSCVLTVAGIFIYRVLLGPLNSMTRQLKEIGENAENLSLELNISSRNELGELAYYFNKRTKALRESEERYRTIFYRASEGISLSTADGVFLAVNPRFAEILGYDSPEEVCRSVTSPELYADSNVREPIIAQLRDGQDIVHAEVWLKKKDGSKVLILLNLGVVRNSKGEIRYIVAMILDITRNRQLEEELRQAQKMEAIGTLAGGIAHDFNNILASISGYTEMAMMKAPPESPVSECMEQVSIAASRARELVRQILAFSRNSDYEKRPLDISVIVKEALKLLRSTLPSSIEIITEIEGVSPVFADPTGMHQIVMNLCTNAYHAMREGGRLEVRLREEVRQRQDGKARFAVLTVRDTGTGMSPETVEKIFEPYFTTKTKQGGTGLGLAVVHGIVKNFGGVIEVETAPGKGTAFHIYLPAVTAQKAQEDQDSPKREIKRGSGQKVMFVDDEQMICNLCRFMLGDAGYNVEVFDSSREAFLEFRKDPDSWDLIITDMTMPEMSGAELIKNIKKFSPDIPVILCTGYSDILTKDTIEELGLAAFIEKPVRRDELLYEVSVALNS